MVTARDCGKPLRPASTRQDAGFGSLPDSAHAKPGYELNGLVLHNIWPDTPH
jgi:hypothetical protein